MIEERVSGVCFAVSRCRYYRSRCGWWFARVSHCLPVERGFGSVAGSDEVSEVANSTDSFPICCTRALLFVLMI